MIRKIALCVALAIGLWGCGGDDRQSPESECHGSDLVYYQGTKIVGVSPNDPRCIGGNHG